MSEVDGRPIIEASTPYVQTVPTALASLFHKGDPLDLQRMMLVVIRITVILESIIELFATTDA